MEAGVELHEISGSGVEEAGLVAGNHETTGRHKERDEARSAYTYNIIMDRVARPMGACLPM